MHVVEIASYVHLTHSVGPLATLSQKFTVTEAMPFQTNRSARSARGDRTKPSTYDHNR
jgi:hypothetical protein